MVALDRVLGFGEFFLVIASLIWLVMAAFDPERKRVRRASLLAVVLAATVAQPFGVVASKEDRFPYDKGTLVSPTGVHVAHLGILPVAPFRLYSRRNLTAGWAENAPDWTLRARSWLWMPLLTNSTKVADMCDSSTLTPCWPDYNSLVLARTGHTYWGRRAWFGTGRAPARSRL